MAGLGETFVPDEVEPRDNMEPVPAGIYIGEVVESDVVDTKFGTGKMVKLTWRITEGPCEGRQIWDNINFRNANETAQKIGQQALAELCNACGIRGPLDDTELLHGVPVKLRVTIEQDKSGQYGPRNAVKRYSHAAEGEPATQSPAPRQQAPAQRQSAPPQTRAAGGATPWANRR